ncbi:MAG: L-serine ammonia-lyase, iron-sulfur-dependent, subunit alpha, partial [Oceanicaulis sp.]
MSTIDFATYLKEEWKPALGCTEPASIAYAAAMAASVGGAGPITGLRLLCDPRIYKNCYAVGIPHSGHKVGIIWTLAIGSLLPDPSLKLECFRRIDAKVLEQAEELISKGVVTVEVDTSRTDLFIEVLIERGEERSVAVIEGGHTRLTWLEANGEPQKFETDGGGEADGFRRDLLARMSFEQMVEMSSSLRDHDRAALREGMQINEAIARHGLSLLPERFVDLSGQDLLTKVSRLVCGGVLARMMGEDFVVMSLSGSGNKGIVCSVPLAVYGREAGHDPERIDRALALACLLTSATTHHLGTLSAVCGCSNAAGIGLAAGLTL